MLYEKQSIPLDEQINKLKSRGLIITNDYFARHYLKNVSYYRLAGYWWPMQADKINHVFKPNSRFEDVIALYSFDSELRLLVFTAIERIEIGLRTRMINYLSHEFNPWWFENPLIFKSRPAFDANLKALARDLKKSKGVLLTSITGSTMLIPGGHLPGKHLKLSVSVFYPSFMAISVQTWVQRISLLRNSIRSIILT